MSEQVGRVNITEFLEARIAEDEAVGRDVAASFAQVDAARAKRGWSPLPDAWNIEAGSDGDPLVSIGPSRVIAECAAKRAIVAMFTGATEAAETLDTMGAWEAHAIAKAAAVTAEGALRHLAAVYDQHPDYDPAWRIA